ncbi:glycosyltransferase family 2 protein [Vibrio apostichopi]|uniref:glycosyltransferase family 2 protein n=1 Tax=Vibrio apostichopi TaxID=3035453 RepID=UPI002574420F|nr:glycosyltransferase family 2 protein [Vibrio sp. FE10]
MLVSIITATYNSSGHILETYNCIVGQSHSDWEWLVTDDCSTDNTVDILNDISQHDNRVKVYRNSVNSGAAVSRNNSLTSANGEFIAFIDSDDTWVSSKLELQVGFMEKQNVDFCFTAYQLMDEFGVPLNTFVDSKQVGAFTYEDMLRKKATLGCSTVLLRSASFIDLQMPLIRTGQDYATWLKLLKTGKDAYVFPKALTNYRIMPGSISRNKVKKAMRQWQIYRHIEKLTLSKSLICFSFYAWRAVFRK